MVLSGSSAGELSSGRHLHHAPANSWVPSPTWPSLPLSPSPPGPPCSVIQDEHEGAAKKGLAVLTEMWRRHVWRDAKTVNVIAAAALHKSSRIMLASLKFFLGQDTAEAEKGDGEGWPCEILSDWLGCVGRATFLVAMG